LTGLPAGSYRAKVLAFGYAPREIPVVIKEGATAALDIDLDAPGKTP